MSICGCGPQLPGTHRVQEFLLTQGVILPGVPGVMKTPERCILCAMPSLSVFSYQSQMALRHHNMICHGMAWRQCDLTLRHTSCKGSLRAGAKRRFEHSVHVLSDSSCLQDCRQLAVHLLWPSYRFFRLHFRYYFRFHFRLLLQSEKGIAMHSLCETSCPPRTVHYLQLLVQSRQTTDTKWYIWAHRACCTGGLKNQFYLE